MKKNYNYAYDGLRKSWNDSVRFLNKSGFVKDAQDLGELQFTNACLQNLESKIEYLKETVTDESEIKYDEQENSELQTREYQLSILKEESSEEAFSSSEMNRKATCFGLTRTKQDFAFLYKDIKSEFIKICEDKNANDFSNFLSENPWSTGVLIEIGSELSIKALEQNDLNFLDLIFKNDSNISEYKLKLFKIALAQQNLDNVKFLLAEDKYSLKEISTVLGSKEYYSSSLEIISTLTDYLSESVHKISAVNYNAMFLYSKKEYEEAIKGFEQIISESEGRSKQIALFYKGLCLQYSDKSDDAIAVFQLIVGGDIDEYYDNTSSIKEHAQKHLDALNKIDEKQQAIVSLQDNIESIENEYLTEYKEVIKNLLQNLWDFIKTPKDLAVATKEVINMLFKIKFINLKKVVSEDIVSVWEFCDMPDLYTQMTKDLDAEELIKYSSAIAQIDYTIGLVGEITDGLIVETVI